MQPMLQVSLYWRTLGVHMKRQRHVPRMLYFWCQLHRSLGSDDMCAAKHFTLAAGQSPNIAHSRPEIQDVFSHWDLKYRKPRLD